MKDRSRIGSRWKFHSRRTRDRQGICSDISGKWKSALCPLLRDATDKHLKISANE
jgi:hypothetical protein